MESDDADRLRELVHELEVHQEELRTQNDALRAAQLGAEASEARYRALFEGAPVAYFVICSRGVVERANRKARSLLGRSVNALRGKPFRVFLDMSSRERFDLHLRRTMLSGEDRTELTLTDAEGTPLRIVAESQRQASDEGIALCRTMVVDITALREAELGRELAEHAVDSALEGIAILDRRLRLVKANPAYLAMVGESMAEAHGKPPPMLTSEYHDANYYGQIWHALHRSRGWQGELWLRHVDGRALPLRASLSMVGENPAGDPEYYVLTCADIAEQERAREQLRYLAYYDRLTGLPNRLLFEDRLVAALAMARRHGWGVAVLFVDLDRFKLINDTLGHRIGDALLQQVARRLRDGLRESDTLSRMGGDEFTVLISEVGPHSEATVAAERLLDRLKAPFTIEQHSIYVGASVGIAHYPEHGDDADTLLKNSDIAMYRAKTKGLNGFAVFDPADHTTANERLTLEMALREAIARDELSLAFQPQVELASGAIESVEALLRWTHPVLGEVPPDRFIRVAEESGYIVTIGRWVLEQACRAARRWQQHHDLRLRVAVNLSQHQFLQQDLVDFVAHTLEDTGLSPELLELEITESGVMPNPDHTIETLTRLQRMGVSISIDDFGTGFSSLSQLKRLPLDTLKVAEVFVRDTPGDPDDAALATTVIRMAQTMGLRVVAEGVETEDQYAFLRAMGATAIQGYLLARPCWEQQIPELMADPPALPHRHAAQQQDCRHP